MQGKAAIFRCHREKWMLKHRDVAAHPGMHVALDRNGDFLAGKAFLDPTAWRLRLVPFAIICWGGMNVMGHGIAISDAQSLIRTQRHHMRSIHAAFLINHDRVGGCVESTIAQPALDENNYVL